MKKTRTEEYLTENIRAKRDAADEEMRESDLNRPGRSDLWRSRRDTEGRIPPDHILDAEGRLRKGRRIILLYMWFFGIVFEKYLLI